MLILNSCIIQTVIILCKFINSSHLTGLLLNILYFKDKLENLKNSPQFEFIDLNLNSSQFELICISIHQTIKDILYSISKIL